MTERYAELMLYMGLCNNHGFGEGKFSKNLNDNYSKKRYMGAVQHVRKIIDLGATREEYVPSLEYGYFKIVEDETEAKKLIEYCQQNIPSAEEVIELLDSMHGKIRFLRNIKFNGATQQDKSKLIEVINKSGIGPIKHPHEEDYYWKHALMFR